jgi:MFS family permease
VGRLREPLRALRAVFANPNLRRVQLALAGSIVGQYSFSIALAVFAFHHGGAGAVGVLVLVRTLPAAVVSPFAAVVGDRTRRERVMLVSDLVRAVAVGGAAAVVLAGGAWQLVYVVAGFTGVVGTIFRPAEAALLPTLARSPEELAAGNVSSSAIESVGAFVGPAIGGLVVAASTGAAFLLTVATFLWSAALVARLRPELSAAAAEPAVETTRVSLGTEVLAGFRTVVAEPKLRVVVGLYAAQTVVAGGLTVLVVVVSLRLLNLGNAGVGYLNSALGVGGLIGGAVTLALVGRRRLAGDFGVGIVLWGVPLLVIGLHPDPALALVMLGLLGVGNTLVDVSAVTLLQRSAANDVLARVFGVVEGLTVGAMAVGAIVAPVLVSSLGTRTALVVTGAFLPAVALLAWPRLVAIDREARVPSRQLELLREIPMFAPLPPTTLESLAHALRLLHVPAGADVVRAGEAGDDYFVIDEGRAEVVVGSEPKPLGPGDAFGEIALLRDVPRTATVRAVTDLRLYALAREPFLEAVTGHVPSLRAADLLVAERLGSMRARGIEPPRSVSSTGT